MSVPCCKSKVTERMESRRCALPLRKRRAERKARAMISLPAAAARRWATAKTARLFHHSSVKARAEVSDQSLEYSASDRKNLRVGKERERIGFVRGTRTCCSEERAIEKYLRNRDCESVGHRRLPVAAAYIKCTRENAYPGVSAHKDRSCPERSTR